MLVYNCKLWHLFFNAVSFSASVLSFFSNASLFGIFDRLIQSQHNVSIIVPRPGFVSVTCARVRPFCSSSRLLVFSVLLCLSSTRLAVQSENLQLLKSTDSVFVLLIKFFRYFYYFVLQ